LDDGVLDLIFLDLVELQGVFQNLLNQGASVENFRVKIIKVQFHFIKFLAHFIETVPKAEHLRVLFNEKVACLCGALYENLLLVFALELINLIILIVNLEHMLSTAHSHSLPCFLERFALISIIFRGVFPTAIFRQLKLLFKQLLFTDGTFAFLCLLYNLIQWSLIFQQFHILK
jgi:hypothetical protein